MLGCAVLCLVAQLCSTLHNPMNCSPSRLSVHRILQARVDCHALLQGIFPTQGSNSGLPHCRWILYGLSHQMFFSFFFFFLIYFWLYWVFVAVHVWVSHCSDLSCCGAQTLGPGGSAAVMPKFSCPMAGRIFTDLGSNLCLLHWQADFQQLNHQGSP